MSASAPFQVTPEALTVVASLLGQHPEMQAGLILIPSFEALDERGAVEARFAHEHFMIAFDSPEEFSDWPRVELCGQNVSVARDALERLRGNTLDIQARDIIYIAGGKETRQFLVAAWLNADGSLAKTVQMTFGPHIDVPAG